MKKTITLIAGLLLVTNFARAQFFAADFENLTLPTDSFYQDTTGADFYTSDVEFQYDWMQSMWGDYWSGGFSYSNMTDSVTSGFGNMYSAKAGGGYNSSTNYVVSQNYSIVRLMLGTPGQKAMGFFVTNSTYAYNSMRDGDAFAKKFGGTTGDDPDW